MIERLERLRLALPGLWAGMLLSVAVVAAPAAFATLPRAQAGGVVAFVFAREAFLSLAFGAFILVLEKRRSGLSDAPSGQRSSPKLGLLLTLGALLATVLGYYALQPLMAQARLGESALTFLQWHAIGLAFYGVKIALVLGLVWQAAGPNDGGSA